MIEAEAAMMFSEDGERQQKPRDTNGMRKSKKMGFYPF